MINPNQFTKIKNKKIGEAIVAIAGPLMNILLAFIIVIIYSLLIKYNVSLGSGNIETIIHSIIWAMISINLGLAVFNLLPIPPLDGFSILSLLLPKKITIWLENNQIVISIIFLALIWTGFLSRITIPFLTYLIDLMLRLVNLIIG